MSTSEVISVCPICGSSDVVHLCAAVMEANAMQRRNDSAENTDIKLKHGDKGSVETGVGDSGYTASVPHTARVHFVPESDNQSKGREPVCGMSYNNKGEPISDLIHSNMNSQNGSSDHVNHIEDTDCPKYVVIYLGSSSLDRRFPPKSAMTWVMAEVKQSRDTFKEVQLQVRKSTLVALSYEGSEAPIDTVFEHNLHTLSRFAKTHQDPRCFAYLRRQSLYSDFECHVFLAHDEKVLAQLNRYEEVLSKCNAEAIKRSQTQIAPTTDIMEVCPSPLRLAQQLTHIELERLSQIGPEEFVQAFSKEEVPNKIPVFRDMKKTHNLEAYVQWFNRLSYLVASEICSHLKKKNRVKLVEYFIDVAKECINIGNFNSLMAIIAGMNMNPVARLKKTWAKVNKAKFGILELQMDPSNNFGSYRSCLKAAMWRSQGANDTREKIVIPFFSLFVKDIYFLNEGHANRSENGNINFEKFWQLAKHISDFVTWQQVECPFEKHADVLHYILTSPVFSETTLSLASFECEPPENSYDKERHKKLKAEAGL